MTSEINWEINNFFFGKMRERNYEKRKVESNSITVASMIRVLVCAGTSNVVKMAISNCSSCYQQISVGTFEHLEAMGLEINAAAFRSPL